MLTGYAFEGQYEKILERLGAEKPKAHPEVQRLQEAPDFSWDPEAVFERGDGWGWGMVWGFIIPLWMLLTEDSTIAWTLARSIHKEVTNGHSWAARALQDSYSYRYFSHQNYKQLQTILESLGH